MILTDHGSLLLRILFEKKSRKNRLKIENFRVIEKKKEKKSNLTWDGPRSLQEITKPHVNTKDVF